MKTLLLALAALVSLSLVSHARAEDPAGFAGFSWGTPRADDGLQKLIREKCRWSVNVEKLENEGTIACYEYPLDGVGPVVLNLEFAGRMLDGYTIIAPGRRLADFRAWVKRQFGEPASVMRLTGEIATWQWASGVTAIFREYCMRPADACLSLASPTGARRAGGRRDYAGNRAGQ